MQVQVCWSPRQQTGFHIRHNTHRAVATCTAFVRWKREGCRGESGGRDQSFQLDEMADGCSVVRGLGEVGVFRGGGGFPQPSGVVV